MKKIVCGISIALAMSLSCALCACAPADAPPPDNKPSAVKIAEIDDISKAYFAGSSLNSIVTVDLTEYVEGEHLTYAVTCDAPDACSVTMDGNVLMALIRSEEEAPITVEVSSNGVWACEFRFTIRPYVCKKIACVGDSLTYGHYWHSESWPVYLKSAIDEKFGKNKIEVSNFGRNGATVTNCSGREVNPQYTTQTQYSESLSYGADVVFLMLGTNDGTYWANAQASFEKEYRDLIRDYLDAGAKQVVLMTAPPTLAGNAFGIPNDTLRENVCPIQRTVAKDLGLPLLDMRKIFEETTDLTQFYRENDGVHFSIGGAKFVAEHAAEQLKTL